jgi:hypothetical protein
MTSWVQHMPAVVYRGGRPLQFTFDTRQTSRDVVLLLGFYIGMFDASTTASARSESRGVTVRWYDPVAKRWRSPTSIDPRGGWYLGPPPSFTISHDQVINIQVKIWFGKGAWLGVHQLEAITDGFAILTPAGVNITAELSMPNNPQYRFDVLP